MEPVSVLGSSSNASTDQHRKSYFSKPFQRHKLSFIVSRAKQPFDSSSSLFPDLLVSDSSLPHERSYHHHSSLRDHSFEDDKSTNQTIPLQHRDRMRFTVLNNHRHDTISNSRQNSTEVPPSTRHNLVTSSISIQPKESKTIYAHSKHFPESLSTQCQTPIKGEALVMSSQQLQDSQMILPSVNQVSSILVKQPRSHSTVIQPDKIRPGNHTNNNNKSFEVILKKANRAIIPAFPNAPTAAAAVSKTANQHLQINERYPSTRRDTQRNLTEQEKAHLLTHPSESQSQINKRSMFFTHERSDSLLSSRLTTTNQQSHSRSFHEIKGKSQRIRLTSVDNLKSSQKSDISVEPSRQSIILTNLLDGVFSNQQYAKRASIRMNNFSTVPGIQGSVLRSLKRMLQGRVEIDVLMLFQGQDCTRLVGEFSKHWPAVISAITRRNLDQVQMAVINLLNALVRLNEMDCFMNILLFLIKINLDFSDFNRAAFFLVQGKLICDYTANHRMKVYFLKLLATAATEKKKYREAISFSNKGMLYISQCAIDELIMSLLALQYAWYLKDTASELQIYDQLGLNHFYVGEIDIAKIYHDKFMRGKIEDENSLFRSSAASDIQYFFRKLEIRSQGFTRSLFLRLSLPILNIFDDRYANAISSGGSTESFTCDANKFSTWRNANCFQLISGLLSTPEFEYQLPTPQISIIESMRAVKTQGAAAGAGGETDAEFDLDEGEEKAKAIKKHSLRAIKLPVWNKEQQTGRTRTLSDPRQLRVSLESKVKAMVNDKNTYTECIAKINRIVSNNSHQGDTNPTTAFLNHQENSRLQQMEDNSLLPHILKEKYTTLFSDIVAEFIIRRQSGSVKSEFAESINLF